MSVLFQEGARKFYSGVGGAVRLIEKDLSSLSRPLPLSMPLSDVALHLLPSRGGVSSHPLNLGLAV